MEKVEDNANIFFHYENIDFLLDEGKYKRWLQLVFDAHDANFSTINFIFCDDEYLLDINRQYLDHDYYTDIISFPYAEHPDPIKGDIFISIDRVKENATSLSVSFENELMRVMAHGLLHFLGYKDKSEEEQQIMRAKEEEMIALFSNG